MNNPLFVGVQGSVYFFSPFFGFRVADRNSKSLKINPEPSKTAQNLVFGVSILNLKVKDGNAKNPKTRNVIENMISRNNKEQKAPGGKGQDSTNVTNTNKRETPRDFLFCRLAWIQPFPPGTFRPPTKKTSK